MPLCLAENDSTDAHEPAAAAPPQSLAALHVINGEHYSGAERVQDLLAAELPPLGCRVGLACLKPGRFPEVRRAKKAPLYNVAMQTRCDPRPVWRLAQLVRRERYQLLHAHTPRTLLMAAPASILAGVPLVYHLHSPASRDSTRGAVNLVNAVVERAVLVRASAVIAVSESLAQHARRWGVSERKIHVVHNGVPCRTARGPRSAAQTTWTLGAIALFRPRKGTEVLFEALARLRAVGLPVRLRAVGGFETPEYERSLKSLVARLGLAEVVTWTGFTEDVDAQLAQMDLFVLPSLFGEGLPMVVLEAMSAGVPVVATRVEGVPETLRDGLDGLLAAPGDAESLAAAIARAVRGEVNVESLRRSALARHAAHFSAASMAAGVLAVYRQVLGA